ncbi:MAG: DUF6250 domain-containing protein [Planctomycetota bacterium]
MLTYLSISMVLMFATDAHQPQEGSDGPSVGGYIATALLHEDDFEAGLEQWQIEQQPGGKAFAKDGVMEIDAAGGCTAWFKQKLESPVLVQFEVTMVKEGGANDRVSDLNSFMMATDPTNDDLLANGKKRGGKFGNYHKLKLYYVGYGANNNSTTRFRRYVGDGTRPVLPEHDLKGKHKPNVKRTVQILVADGVYQYWIDGKRVYYVEDESPYTEGWFALRTVKNRMRVEHFRAWRIELEEPES